MRFYRLIGLLSLPLAAIAQAQDQTQTETQDSQAAENAEAVTTATPVEAEDVAETSGDATAAEAPTDEAVAEETGSAGDDAALDVAEAVVADEPVSDIYLFTQEEIDEVPFPELAFDSADVKEKDFEKYFYFHRDDTSFSEAYADLTECDQLSSGISYYAGGGEPYPGYYGSQYGIGGAVGGMLGSMMADAIFGSSARRKIRRINIRNCMGFKAYQRYGLKKDLWKEFNFEEGNGRKRDDVREAALLQQARVASGPKPTAEGLGI